MKKLVVVLLSVLLVFGLAACGGNESKNDEKTITVVATLDPHSKVLEFAKDILAKDGWDLKITVVDDYYIPNKSVDGGDADANYFQHVPFFDGEVSANDYALVNAAGIHIEPFGFYSKTITSVDALKDGAKVVISNSVADHGRILSILDKAGVITLKEGVDALNATTADIASNPKNLVFIEVKPELLTLAFENNEGDLVAINGNYAIQGGLNPTKDAVILEQADATNPYVNILACRAGEENSEKIQALVKVLKSDEVRNFILSTYSDGSVIPAE